MSLNASLLHNDLTTMYRATFSAGPEGSHCWTWCPHLMDAQWQQNKQLHWLVTLVAWARLPMAWLTRGRKKSTVKSSFICKKGVTECKTARQEKWDYLIHRVSQSFPRGRFLDESRCCCLCGVHWSSCAGCCVFTLSHSFIVQLVLCEVWFSRLVKKFPCTVYWQTSKQPLLSLV